MGTIGRNLLKSHFLEPDHRTIVRNRRKKDKRRSRPQDQGNDAQNLDVDSATYCFTPNRPVAILAALIKALPKPIRIRPTKPMTILR